MGLRIILVGAVAALGLTLPTGEQLGKWQGTARCWVNARLADWDALEVVDEDAFVVAPDPVSDRPDVAATPTPVVSEADAPAAPAVTTETVASEIELPAGLDAPTRPMDFETSAPAPVAAVPVSDADAALIAAQEEFVAGFVGERASSIAADLARTETAPTVVEPVPAADADFNAAQEEFIAGFAAERTEGPALAVVVPTAEVEASENLYEGLAYALNREAEGLDASPAPAAERAGEARPSDRDGRLTNAVRLTRQAVHAWANLLHGPAVVTIER